MERDEQLGEFLARKMQYEQEMATLAPRSRRSRVGCLGRPNTEDRRVGISLCTCPNYYYFLMYDCYMLCVLLCIVLVLLLVSVLNT